MTLLFSAAVLLGLSSCAAPMASFKAGYDFPGIQAVGIGEFTPSADQPNSGSVVAGEFAKQLLSRGYSVKDFQQGVEVDAVIEGDVTEYLPNHRYLVSNPPRGGRGNVIVQQPVELSGSNAYNLGSSFGMGDDSQVVVSNATVGISARMRDARTGEVIWASHYTYEGLDLDTALEGVVQYLLSSIPGNK